MLSRKRQYFHGSTVSKEKGFDAFMEDVLDAMNINTGNKDNKKIFREMFNKTDYNSGDYAGYALEGRFSKGMSGYIVTPDKSSGYSSFLFMAKEQDVGKLHEALNGLTPDDFRSYYAMSHTEAASHGAVFELPHINKYPVMLDNDGNPVKYITTIRQGENFEKILRPILNATQIQDSTLNNANMLKMQAYMNEPEYEVLSMFRKYFGNAGDHIQDGDYDRASRAGRKVFDELMSRLPASSSYRGVDYKMHLGPNDFITAYEYEIGEGMHRLFKRAVAGGGDVEAANMNVAQQVVYAFGQARGISMKDYRNDYSAYLMGVFNNDEFTEFFQKRLVLGSPLDDVLDSLDMKHHLIQVAGSEKEAEKRYGKNLVKILTDVVYEDTHDNNGNLLKNGGRMFHSSVMQMLENPVFNGYLNPVLSESASEKGVVSAVDPGEFSAFSSWYSTLRPVYTQQANGLPFGIDDIKLSEFTGAFDKSISVGHNTITHLEAQVREALASAGIDTGERNFSIKVKEMSVNDVNMAYKKLMGNTSQVQLGHNATAGEYNKVLAFMMNDISSMHEDKVFIAPVLKQQELFANRDAVKLTMNLDSMDLEKTAGILEQLYESGSSINRDTVIGITKNGRPMFYTGSTVERLLHSNVEDLLDSGSTRLYTRTGDITDDKMMFNGLEKATVHTADIGKLMEQTGITDKNKALYLANKVFEDLSDGALAIGSFKFGKHGGLVGLHSAWNLIEARYAEAVPDGNSIDRTALEDLVLYLNKATDGNMYFSVSSDGNRILSSTVTSDHSADIIAKLVEDIRANTGENGTVVPLARHASLNKAIVSELEDMASKDILMMVAQRQNMNEHIGKKLFVDQRMEQAITMRGLNADGNIGIDAIDAEYSNVLKSYSGKYTGAGSSLSSLGYGSLQGYINNYANIWNDERIGYTKSHNDMKRTVHGTSEVINFFNNPMTASEIHKKAIVEVDINELLDEIHGIKSGVSASELKSSIFFTDGKPSKWLENKALQKGFDITKENSYSIFINTGSIKPVTKNGSRAFDGFLIPIQSADTVVNDKRYFQSAQSSTVRFINNITGYLSRRKNFDNKDGKFSNISEALGNAYENYINELKPQVKYMQKDSDLYKTMQHYIMPTSQELLGQDETSPLLRSQLFDKNIQELADRKYMLQKKLAGNNSEEDLKAIINELGSVSKELDDNFKRLANDIREGGKDVFSGFATINDSALSNASKVTIGGRTYHGMGMALSEEAFERQGLHFGAVAMDVIADIENGTAKMEQSETFLKQHGMYSDKILDIRHGINGLGIEGLHIKENETLLKGLDRYANETGLGKKGWVTIRDFNENIARTQNASKILDVFRKSGIGQDYMHEVGMYGDFVRFPSFRTQPMVRMLLDPGMKGFQFRSLNPVLSLVSNLDFDGDKAFVMSMLDGMSVLKQDSREFGIIDRIYKRFIKNESDSLLADLIESGDAFAKEDPYNVVRQQAQLLKIFDDSAYTKGLEGFASAHGYSMEALKDSEAITYAAESSAEMAGMFSARGFNEIRNSNSAVAALAARIRKKHIGYASTPNYKVRETIHQFIADPGTSEEQREMAALVYESLTNMHSQSGGMFDMVEQKSIDTKHALDGLEVSKVTRWSVNMQRLMSGGRDGAPTDPSSASRYIYNMMEAMERVFGFKSKEQIAEYTALVTSHTMGQVMAMDGIDATTRSALAGFSGLFTLATKTDINRIYNRNVDANNIDSLVGYINGMTGNELETFKEAYANTGLNKEVIEAIAESESAPLPPYKANHVYYQAGTLQDPSGHAFVYTSEEGFKEIDIDTFAVKPGIAAKKSIGLTDNISRMQYIYNDLKNNQVLQAQFRNEMSETKLAHVLDSMVLDRNGKINKGQPHAFAEMASGKNKGKYNALGNDMYNVVTQLFTNKNGSSDVYAGIQKYANAYDNLVMHGNTTKSMPGSSADLIRQLNRSIAENQEIYIGQSGFMEDYDKLLGQAMEQYFGNKKNFNNYIRTSMETADFDNKKFTQAIEHFYNNTYNINNETMMLNGMFDDLSEHIDDMKKRYGATEAEMAEAASIHAGRDTDINNIIITLENTNKKVMSETEDTVYGMFKDAKQFDFVFGFSGINGEDGMRVGFGKYMGVYFKDISTADKQAILAEAEEVAAIVKDNSIMEHAVDVTVANLKGFNAKESQVTHIPARMESDIVSQQRDAINDAMDKTFDAISRRNAAQEEEAAERISEAAKKAASNASSAGAGSNAKKTLHGGMADGISSFFKNNKKTIGISAAALAGIGVVNSLLHNDRVQSPLEPARTSDNNNVPYYDNGKDSGIVQPPPSPKTRTVYHDKNSGFDFKVSASTMNALDARNNAKLISASGAPQNASVYNVADMSGVSDNWLENEFAKLI